MTRAAQVEAEVAAATRVLAPLGVSGLASGFPDVRGVTPIGTPIAIEVTDATSEVIVAEDRAIKRLHRAIEVAMPTFPVFGDITLSAGFLSRGREHAWRDALVAWLWREIATFLHSGHAEIEFMPQRELWAYGRGKNTRSLPAHLGIDRAWMSSVSQSRGLLVHYDRGTTCGDPILGVVRRAIAAKVDRLPRYRAALPAGMPLWLVIVAPWSRAGSRGVPFADGPLAQVRGLASAPGFDRTFLLREETDEAIELT